MSDTNKISFDWPFPDFRKEQKLWKLKSRLTVFMVGFASRVVLYWLTNSKVYNKDKFVKSVFDRPPGVPLITVCNHESCVDDPGLIGPLLNSKQLWREQGMRWSLAAHDICFSRSIHGKFFSLGKCVPVVRGMGVYQRAVDFVIDRLNTNGDWLHIFPEGKINMTPGTLLRLKWGVGRIISDCKVPPIVLPLWHTGMPDVLPNTPPYIPRLGKNVLVNIGEPIDTSDIVRKVQDLNAMQKRKVITDFIQNELEELRVKTLNLAKEIKEEES